MLEKVPESNHHSLRANYSLDFFHIFFTQDSSYPFFSFLILIFVANLNSLSQFYQIPIFFLSFIFIQLILYFFFDLFKCCMSFFTSDQIANCFLFLSTSFAQAIFIYLQFSTIQSFNCKKKIFNTLGLKKLQVIFFRILELFITIFQYSFECFLVLFLDPCLVFFIIFFL